METYSRMGSPLADLPPVDGAEYLIDALMDVGPAVPGAGGSIPITYSDIRDYRDVTGFDLSAWDAQMLRYLSRVYVGQSVEAKKINAPAPYEEAMDLDQKRKAVVAGFKAFGKRANQ